MSDIRGADLPGGSIVATANDAFLKCDCPDHAAEPWMVTGVSEWQYSDAEVNAKLESGEASVLRVGKGES